MNNGRVQALDLYNPAKSYAQPAIRSSATFYLAAPLPPVLFIILAFSFRDGTTRRHFILSSAFREAIVTLIKRATALATDLRGQRLNLGAPAR
jgi:hypothetical protein